MPLRPTSVASTRSLSAEKGRVNLWAFLHPPLPIAPSAQSTRQTLLTYRAQEVRVRICHFFVIFLSQHISCQKGGRALSEDLASPCGCQEQSCGSSGPAHLVSHLVSHLHISRSWVRKPLPSSLRSSVRDRPRFDHGALGHLLDICYTVFRVK